MRTWREVRNYAWHRDRRKSGELSELTN